MGESLNESLLRRFCSYLNANFSNLTEDGVEFRPGQLLKEGFCAAVFPEGSSGRVDFVDGGFRESMLFTLLLKSSGDMSETRYKSCEILDGIADALRRTENFDAGTDREFLYFDDAEKPRFVSRGINGDEVYSVKILLRYDRKGEW